MGEETRAWRDCSTLHAWGGLAGVTHESGEFVGGATMEPDAVTKETESLDISSNR
jgi:hypothetical protein